jgi:hypothetical protein
MSAFRPPCMLSVLTLSHWRLLERNVESEYFVTFHCSPAEWDVKVKKVMKATPVRGCGGPYACETLRLTASGYVWSLTSWRPFTPGRFLALICISGWVCLRAIVGLEGFGQLKKECNDLIGNRTHDLPACSIAPHPTTRVICALNIRRSL